MSDAGCQPKPTPLPAIGWHWRPGTGGNLKFGSNQREVAKMWARRLLLLTIVAAAAMSLPRHVPNSWNVGFGSSQVASNSIR